MRSTAEGAEKPARVLSFGAGVQSTCLLHLSLRGELDPLDAVVFADTGWEPRSVYEHLERCRELCESAGVAFYKTHYRNLRADTIEAADRQAKGESGGMRATFQPPLYSRPAGVPESKPPSMMKRYCTTNYKTHGIDKAVNAIRREWCKARGIPARRENLPKVEVWLGISLDEIERMKSNPRRRPWFSYRHPLAWELRWTRSHCLAWMEREGFPRPPRSACVGCPYRSNREWRDLRDGDPDGWADAVELDAYIRHRTNDGSRVYLHRSGKPLAEADIDSETPPLLGFLQECSGMCGV